MNAKDRYMYWMEKLADTDPLWGELAGIADREEEIEDRFYQPAPTG